MSRLCINDLNIALSAASDMFLLLRGYDCLMHVCTVCTLLSSQPCFHILNYKWKIIPMCSKSKFFITMIIVEIFV